jgi:hypothetical protein
MRLSQQDQETTQATVAELFGADASVTPSAGVRWKWVTSRTARLDAVIAQYRPEAVMHLAASGYVAVPGIG